MNKRSLAAFHSAVNAGRYDKGLALCLAALKASPANPTVLANAAVCCIKLNSFDRAIGFALKAHALDPDNFQALDAIAHAAGCLERHDDVRRYGCKALEARDRRFAGEPTALPPSRQASGTKRIIPRCSGPIPNIANRRSSMPKYSPISIRVGVAAYISMGRCLAKLASA